jgi:hypothetical protein
MPSGCLQPSTASMGMTPRRFSRGDQTLEAGTAPAPTNESATMSATMSATNVVECFGVSLRHGELVGRRVRVPQDGDPDQTAARSIGLTGTRWDGVAVLHSTSWRWDPASNVLYLTYLCCPDPNPDADVGQLVLALAAGADPAGDPSRPRPAEVPLSAVLIHGLGHLKWLASNSPGPTRGSRDCAPEVWDAIMKLAEQRAGRI